METATTTNQNQSQGKNVGKYDEKDVVKFFNKYGMLRKDFFDMLLLMAFGIWAVMVVGTLILPRESGFRSVFYMGVAVLGLGFAALIALRWKYMKDYKERMAKKAGVVKE